MNTVPSGTNPAPGPSTTFSTVTNPAANVFVTVTSTDTGSSPSNVTICDGAYDSSAPWESVSVTVHIEPTGWPDTIAGSPTPNVTSPLNPGAGLPAGGTQTTSAVKTVSGGTSAPPGPSTCFRTRSAAGSNVLVTVTSTTSPACSTTNCAGSICTSDAPLVFDSATVHDDPSGNGPNSDTGPGTPGVAPASTVNASGYPGTGAGAPGNPTGN